MAKLAGRISRDSADLARAHLVEVLAKARTRQEVADSAVRAIPELVGADGAVIFLCDDDSHLELVAYMAPLACRDLMEAAGAGWIKLAPDSQVPAAEVVSEGVGSLWVDPGGKGSVETLPLNHGDVGGAIALVFGDGIRTQPSQLSSTEAIQILSETLARATEQERNAESAREYVRSTRPRYLPTIPRLEVGVAIPTSSKDAGESGTWYDVNQPQPFRALVGIGCAGAGRASHSLAAAVRSALLAYGVLSQRPDELLDMLMAFHRTRAYLARSPEVGIARFDVDLDHFSWATTGGMPPVLHRAGKVTPLGEPTDDLSTGEMDLAPGDLILLTADCQSGPEATAEVVDELKIFGGLPPSQLCERLLENRLQRGLGPGGFVAVRIGEDADSRSWSVEAMPVSLAAARERTRNELAHLGVAMPSTVDAAELIVSELLSNVVKHVGGVAEVTIQRLPDRLRLQVGDSGHEESLTVPATDVLADRGRGLFLVDSLARDWGVTRIADGKIVWAELEIEV